MIKNKTQYNREWCRKNKWRCLTKKNISTTSKKALATETKFIFESCLRGWEVCRPLDPSQTYDLLLRLNGAWQTAQIKTVEKQRTTWKSKKVYSRIKLYKGRNKKPYQKGDFDLLVGVDLDDDKIWLIPYSDIKHITCTVTLSPKYDVYLLNQEN